MLKAVLVDAGAIARRRLKPDAISGWMVERFGAGVKEPGLEVRFVNGGGATFWTDGRKAQPPPVRA